jgi:hypothetical protein
MLYASLRCRGQGSLAPFRKKKAGAPPVLEIEQTARTIVCHYKEIIYCRTSKPFEVDAGTELLLPHCLASFFLLAKGLEEPRHTPLLRL